VLTGDDTMICGSGGGSRVVAFGGYLYQQIPADDPSGGRFWLTTVIRV
jgi:hypothetical protein